MEPSSIPVTSVKTGVIQEERSFDWEISNFPVVLTNQSLIKSQQFEFYAGDTIGMGSKWRAYLHVSVRDGRTLVGIFIGLKEKPKALTSEHLCAQFIFTFKNKAGVVKKTLDSKVVNFYDKDRVSPEYESGLGFKRMFDADGELPSYMELKEGSGSLVVHVTFRLFGVSQANPPLKAKLEEFELKSTAKAHADLPMRMENPNIPTYVKVIANDRKEFLMQKDVLAARSPVFQAMLAADMTEGNAGVVKIQDMGSESLKVVLHFLNRGELLPEWKSSSVLVELTNAAAKYELTDLLNFLDGALGDVCNLDNVGMLITLANRLSLKTAEAALLSFLRRKGANTSDNFVQVLNGALTSESEEASGVSTGPGVEEIDGRPRSCSCPCCRGRQGKRTVDEMDEDREENPAKRRRLEDNE